MIYNLYSCVFFACMLFEFCEEQLAEFRARFSPVPPAVSGKLLYTDRLVDQGVSFGCWAESSTHNFYKTIISEKKDVNRSHLKLKRRAVVLFGLNFGLCCLLLLLLFFSAFAAFVAFAFPACAAFVLFGALVVLILIILMISFWSFLILINMHTPITTRAASKRRSTRTI